MCGAGSGGQGEGSAARGREAGLICLSSLFLIAIASIILLPPNCKRFHLYDVLSVLFGVKYRHCLHSYNGD